METNNVDLACSSSNSETSETEEFIYYAKRTESVPKNVTHVRVHPSVKAIGEGAFEGCSLLERIAIPSKGQTVDNCALDGCSKKLMSVELRKGLERI